MNSVFSLQLKEFVERTKLKAETVVRKTALQMQSSMVNLSPVDTGQFRANWNCGIGSLDKSTTQAVDKSGQSVISETASKLDGWEPGAVIWLTNSLPQARALEFGLYGKPPGSANGPKTTGGYSRQAPAGMVRLTVQNFNEYVKKSIGEVK